MKYGDTIKFSLENLINIYPTKIEIKYAPLSPTKSKPNIFKKNKIDKNIIVFSTNSKSKIKLLSLAKNTKTIKIKVKYPNNNEFIPSIKFEPLINIK